jgi:hypothetical protein
MSFYRLPFGHTEWHVDTRKPNAQPRPFAPERRLRSRAARFTR